MPGRVSLARIIQEGLRLASRLSLLKPVVPQKLAVKDMISDQLCADYTSTTSEIPFLHTGIYPTDGIVLWGLIKALRPELFIETGTGTGVSSQICACALRKFVPGARIVTIGTGTPEVVEMARRNLASFPEVEMIEGLAPDGLISIFDRVHDERLGMFIDGPKGSSPDFLRLLEAIFERLSPSFVAVHDCEEHIPAGFDPKGKRPRGFINPTRVQLVAFHESRLCGEYELFFMDNEWCHDHDSMNEVVYGSETGLKPFEFKGSRQRSHSPYMGILLRRDCATIS
jgi:predicted O-methyltransferase YrrM